MRKVRIGSFDYEVIVQDGIVEGSQVFRGRIDYAVLCIRLEAKMCLPRMYEILWHEIVHAVEEQTHPETEEQWCDGFALGITQILRDNTWLSSPQAMAEYLEVEQ